MFDTIVKILETNILVNEIVEEVRIRFLKRYELNPEFYDEYDVRKVKDNEFTVKRFVLCNKLNAEKALHQLDDTMIWRNVNKVSSLTDTVAPIEFYRAGVLFMLGCDKTNQPVIYFRVKAVLKIKQLQPIYNLIAIGVINKIDSETNGCGFTCVLDLDDVSLKNADLDLLQFVINVLKNYFPLSLSKILVHNMPWYLKGFVPLIRLWLTEEEQQIIRFVSNDELFDYIDRQHVPRYMGGDNCEDFTIVPEGCRNVEDIAETYGFTREEAKYYMKKFEPYIEECQQLIIK